MISIIDDPTGNTRREFFRIYLFKEKGICCAHKKREAGALFFKQNVGRTPCCRYAVIARYRG